MNYLNDLKKTLDKYYVKLPKFPKGLNNFIVSVSPWLALIFGALAISAGVLSLMSPFAVIVGLHGYAVTVFISLIILLVQGVIELLAFSPLRGRKIRGWNLMFYSLMLSLISSIVTLNVFSVLNSILGVLIGYYILYQIKSYYK